MADNSGSHVCNRRLFLLGTASTFAGAVLAACSSKGQTPEDLSGYESVSAKDVPVGGSVFLEEFIIAQPEKGVFKAYERSCPHQGGTISITGKGVVKCPEHSSTFDIKDGTVVSGPAPNPMSSALLKAKGETLYVTEEA